MMKIILTATLWLLPIAVFAGASGTSGAASETGGQRGFRIRVDDGQHRHADAGPRGRVSLSTQPLASAVEDGLRPQRNRRSRERRVVPFSVPLGFIADRALAGVVTMDVLARRVCGDRSSQCYRRRSVVPIGRAST